MGASRYVGRVGGLAVALGVGAALTAGHTATAWADDTGSASGPGQASTAKSGTSGKAAKSTRAMAGRTAPGPASSARAGQHGAAPIAAPAAASEARSNRSGRAVTLNRIAAQPSAAAAAAAGTPAPNQQGDPSGIVGLLTAVRREFFNASPTITPVITGQTTSATGQAVITGNFGAADADGDTLYYTYIGDPQNGGTYLLHQF